MTDAMTANTKNSVKADSVKTIGILGGGQLGRMLAQAALPLGIRCVFLEDATDCPASALGKVYTTAQFEAFAQAADAYTLEFENTPVELATQLESKGLSPNAGVLQVAQDRLKEKSTFVDLGIATVPFTAVESLADLRSAAETLGLPLVLKTTRGGYDGKGQFVVKTETDIETAWNELGAGKPLIAEGFIHFSREVSIIAVRSQEGQIATYHLVENEHNDGILAKSIAPARGVSDIEPAAKEAIAKLLEHFNYVGVLTLELFVTDSGILANEIAPRVHNSGHWSIEGAVCSQFENHMRAVAGLPLGSTENVAPSVMFNVISQHPATTDILMVNGAHLHDYDKTARPNRKLAHITVMTATPAELEASCKQVVEALPNKVGLA